jgi:hypothetical protein
MTSALLAFNFRYNYYNTTGSSAKPYTFVPEVFGSNLSPDVSYPG